MLETQEREFSFYGQVAQNEIAEKRSDKNIIS